MNDKINLKLGSIDIKIEFPALNLVSRYMEKEYSLITTKASGQSDIKINIRFKNAGKSERVILQSFKAHGRHFLIEYVDERSVNLNIPYKVSDKTLDRIISPFFESRWEACLVDFFHNVFLGILQIYLLNNGSTLMHASSMIFPGEDKAVVFFGAPQSGKSTLIKLLTENYNGCIISEDFCIASSEGALYSLPHQSRVSIEQSASLKKKTYRFSEKINWQLFEMMSFTGRKPIRRYSFEEIHNSQTIQTAALIGQIFFIFRDGNQIYTENCSKSQFIKLCMDVLENEFRNFAGFREMMSLMPDQKYCGIDWKTLLSKTADMLETLYSILPCRILHIPMYETPQKAASELSLFLLNGGNRDK
jgi:hypothetical protein